MALPDRLAPLYMHLKKTLYAAGVDNAERDARIMIRQHTEFDWADFIANPDTAVPKSKLARIEFDVERRMSGMPISRMYGERAFWGLDFKLNQGTLDPRPDTETLIEIAVDRLADTPPATILDLGTGSGCILISLLSEWPKAYGVGVDVSLQALRAAKGNAQENGVGERSGFIQGSWGQAIKGGFDLLVSNPPYISNRDLENLPREVKNFDPILALDGGEDGLAAYRIIFREIPTLLKSTGTALFEIGYNQQDDIVRLAGDSGLCIKDVHQDLAGIGRVVEISCGDK